MVVHRYEGLTCGRIPFKTIRDRRPSRKHMKARAEGTSLSARNAVSNFGGAACNVAMTALLVCRL